MHDLRRDLGQQKAGSALFLLASHRQTETSSDINAPPPGQAPPQGSPIDSFVFVAVAIPFGCPGAISSDAAVEYRRD